MTMTMRARSGIVVFTVMAIGACDNAASRASRESASARAKAPAGKTLDSLIARLDSAGGHYVVGLPGPSLLVDARFEPDSFVVYGRQGLERLVRCLGDDSTKTTTAASENDDDVVVPRGTLCYEVLTALVQERLPNSLPDTVMQELHDTRPVLGDALHRARTAWDAVIRAGAYDWIRGTNR